MKIDMVTEAEEVSFYILRCAVVGRAVYKVSEEMVGW